MEFGSFEWEPTKDTNSVEDSGEMDWREAHNKLQTVIDEFQGDPFDIPVEEYEPFETAAKVLLDQPERDVRIDPKTQNKQRKMLGLARDVIVKAPRTQTA